MREEAELLSFFLLRDLGWSVVAGNHRRADVIELGGEVSAAGVLVVVDRAFWVERGTVHGRPATDFPDERRSTTLTAAVALVRQGDRHIPVVT